MHPRFRSPAVLCSLAQAGGRLSGDSVLMYERGGYGRGYGRCRRALLFGVPLSLTGCCGIGGLTGSHEWNEGEVDVVCNLAQIVCSSAVCDECLATVSRHREVMSLPSMAPAISDTSFIAPSANVVGNVKVAPRSPSCPPCGVYAENHRQRIIA